MLAAVFALFHAARGAIGQTYLNPDVAKLKKSWQKAIVFYIHDFLLHIFCTLFGFASFLIAY